MRQPLHFSRLSQAGIFLVAAFLAACSSGQVTPAEQVNGDATPSATQTVTPIPLPKTPTRATSPRPSSNPDVDQNEGRDELWDEVPGHAAPGPSPTPTFTRRPTTSAEATSVSIYETEMAMFPDCYASISHYSSPDGKWVAIKCLESQTDFYKIDDPAKKWVISYYETFGNPYFDGDRFGSMYLVHWSVDGNYAYLTPYPCCLDGGCPSYYDGLALFRLDLATGEMTRTLRPGNGLQFYDFSFSNNDRYLAYVQTWVDPPKIHIVDLIHGGEQQIELEASYTGAGDVIWSPDFSQIAFSARIGGDCREQNFSIIVINLEDHSQKVILKGLLNEEAPVAWPEEDMIILLTGYREYSEYNLVTGEMQPYEMPKSYIEP